MLLGHSKKGLIVAGLLILGALSYGLGLFSLSYFYHSNESLSVVFMRMTSYLKDSWKGFLVAALLGSAALGPFLLHSTTRTSRFLRALLLCQVISFLSGFFFFAGMGVLDGENWGDRYALLIYGFVQSGIGMIYVWPASVPASVALTWLVGQWPSQNN